MTGAAGDGLAALAARIRLADLVTHYGNLIDWLAWDELDAVFWPEARFDFGMFAGDLAAYRGFVTALEESYTRRLHLFVAPHIRIAGSCARIDAGSLILCRTVDPAPGFDDKFWGRYLFDAECRDGIWKLSSLTYLLNLHDRIPLAAADGDGPMHFGDDLSPAHRFAWR